MAKKKASKPLDRKQMKTTKGGGSTPVDLTEEMNQLQGAMDRMDKASQAISKVLDKSSQDGQSLDAAQKA